MTLLTFYYKFCLQSSTAVTTASSTLANDTQATQTFNLNAAKTVLIIYTANSEYSSTNGIGGIKNAINVDGTDVTVMNDSGYAANNAYRNTCMWVGSLASGDHTINGRLASAVNAQTTTVDNRTLLIYIFNGDEFIYINDTTTQTASSTTYIDDSVATTTFTPSSNCKALAFYAITNARGSTERYTGKKICINIDGEDQYGEAAKSSNSAVTSPDSLATVYVKALTAVSTTIKGRLSTNTGTQTVSVNRHVLGVLLLDPSVVLDSVASVIPVSSTSMALVNDTEASITRVRGATNELLVLGQATKLSGTTGSMYGLCYGLNVDNVDVALSRSSPAYTSDAESNLVTYATTVTSGSHTINGRFATNYGDTASIVDTRILIALWFPIVTIIQATSSISGGGSLTASLFNIKRTNSTVLGGGSSTASLFNIKRINSTVLGGGSQTSYLGTVNALLNLSTGVGSHYITSDGYYYITSDNNDYLTHDGTLGQDGGGSQTAMLSINKSIASSVNANASKIANIIEFERISSSLSGNCSQSSSIIIFYYLPIVSSISAGGSQNANVIEYEQINSTVLSVGSETAIIKELKQIISLTGGGGGSQTSNPITIERMVSSLTGVGSPSATIIVTTYLPVSFSILGGGSETATIKELEQILSLINGGGSQTSYPITFERINSVLAAVGALTAEVQVNTGTMNLYSYRTGNGSETANIIEFEKITSTVTGGGLQNAALSSRQIITSSVPGGGTSTANIIEWNYISSNILGMGAAAANIIELNYISSNISGVGSQTSNITLLKYIASVISGFGSTQSAISVNKNISSIISGSGSQTANDIVFDLLNGIVIGIGHSSAHLTFIIIAIPHFDHPQTLIINQNIRTIIINQNIRAIIIFRNDRTVTIENGFI